jgi:hypothetical protein
MHRPETKIEKGCLLTGHRLRNAVFSIFFGIPDDGQGPKAQ